MKIVPKIIQFFCTKYSKIISVFFFVLLLGAYTQIFAIGAPYTAGETLNPTCAPGESNCTVTTTTSVTAGSVLFGGSTGALTEDNSNFFYNSTTHRLGLGTTSPNEQLEITGNFRLPATTSTTGIIYQGANPFLHTYGTNNTFLGISAGNFTTTGSENTAIGKLALGSLGDGYYNTAVGYNAMNANTTGTWNAAVGKDALAFNTTGTQNTAMGWSALYANTTGTSMNAFGSQALMANTTGVNNGAFGVAALKANTTGSNNQAFGGSALLSNTTGANNTGIGTSALRFNTTGVGNYGLGVSALRNNVTGSNNVAIGNTSGNGVLNNSFDNNTMVGSNTGLVLTTGSNNILFGFQAGDALTTGSNNIAIGYDIDLPSNTTSNQMSIGNLIYGTGIDGTGTTLSTGNIGIGTATPSNKFSVLGPNKFSAPHQIYSMGDSLTSSGQYQSTLITDLGSSWNSVNKGVSGNKTDVMLARFNADVIVPGDGEYVIIWGGINDIIQGWTVAQVIGSLQSMYNMAHNAGMKVISINITPAKNTLGWDAGKQTSIEAVNAWIASSAANVDYKIDAYSALNDSGNSGALLSAYDSGDHLHLNTDGYTLVGNAVYSGVTWTPIISNAVNIAGNSILYGNVGIGKTSSPSSLLDVNSILNVLAGGTVGIGNTSPTARLDIADTWNTIDSPTGIKLNITNTASGNSSKLLDLQVGNTSQFYVSPIGNVNIAEGANYMYGGSSVITAQTSLHNFFFGGAGNLTMTGASNTATGFHSLYSNTLGNNDTSNGHFSLLSNTEGAFNTAIGSFSAYSNTTGSYNTAIGSNALYLNNASYNTALGPYAMYLSTSGANNIALGPYALYSNSGSNNIAEGYFALSSNTSGAGNVAIGSSNLANNTTGYDNTAIGGSPTLRLNSTGYSNVAIGSNALYSNTTGSKNVAVGITALEDLDITTDNGSGSNTAIGNNTGRGIVTGINNTIIGANVTGLSSSLSNNIIIADGAGNQRVNIGSTGNLGIGGISSPNYKLDILANVASYAAHIANAGNLATQSGLLIQAGLNDNTAAGPSTLIGFQDGDGTDIGSISFGTSAVAYNTTSDQRLKENIVDTSLSLDTLMNIKIRDFTWKADPNHNLYHGVIAQELAQIYPQAVTIPLDENTGYWMVDYSKLTPLIVKSVQELELKVRGYENILHSKEIRTEKLCFDDSEEFCFTKDDLIKFRESIGALTSNPTPSVVEPTTTTTNPSDLTTTSTATPISEVVGTPTSNVGTTSDPIPAPVDTTITQSTDLTPTQ